MNFDAFTAWLALHPEWILGTIALLSFLESLLLVGLIAPGIALLFVVASLAGSAGLPLWQIVLVSGSAATAGDVTSFYVGRHFHHHIAGLAILRRHPQWLERAERFIRRYGMPGLGVGRFIGPLRPFMPMMAGTLEMPQWRFWLVELLTLLPWGVLYMAPGFAVGAAADRAEQSLGGMILVWAALWAGAILLAELVLRSRERALSRQQQVITGWVWAGLCAALFAGIMACVVTGYATRFNQWAGQHWFALRTDWLDTGLVALAGLGEFRPMLIWVVVVTLVLLAQRCAGGAMLWLLMTNGGHQLFSGLKRLTAIERPQWVAEPPASLSFPSGHASMALVFAGTLCVLAWPASGRTTQRLLLWAAASYAFLQATSRPYLGVHWVADIGAGLLLGGALVALAALLKTRFSLRPANPLSLAGATLLAWGIALAAVVVPDLDASLAAYRPLAP
jgi:membrane protein DedA with SNARE-associated domain/membrane-associated phospholipid phosphatase